MRTFLVLVSLCVLLAALAVGLSLTSGAPARTAEPADLPTPPAVEADSDAGDRARQTGELLARLDALAARIDELSTQVAELQAGAGREPATAAPQADPVDVTSAAFAARHRQAILQVIEDDRQEQVRKREDDQRARELQNALSRAERTAQRFGLLPDQQRALTDVYLLERQKMEELRAQMRDQGLPGGTESFREAFRNLRDWSLGELTTRLGPDLAQKISESDSDRFFGAGAGGQRRAARALEGSPDAGGQGGDVPR